MVTDAIERFRADVKASAIEEAERSGGRRGWSGQGGERSQSSEGVV